MVKKKGKSVSFDAMVKFFMQNYGIPTKQDIDKVSEKVDRLEKLLLASGIAAGGQAALPSGRARTRQSSGITASDRVLEVIKRFRSGVGFSDIQKRTGYDEKKLRNIIFRLSKAKKIVSISRGIYIPNS